MSEQPLKSLFQRGDDSAAILRTWWEGLEQDKGERAAMRRASSPAEVTFSPAYHHLLGQLQQHAYKANQDALAVVAGLSAHIKEDAASGKSLAQQMASSRTIGSGAKVSGLRFRRLLAVTQRDDLYPLLIRIIRLLDGKVNLIDLANAVYYWNEKVRRRWAYDYYATAPAEK